MTIQKTKAGASTPPKATEIPAAYQNLATKMLDGMYPDIEQAIDDAVNYHQSAGIQMQSNDFGFRVAVPAGASTESPAEQQLLTEALKAQLRSKGYDNPGATVGTNEDGLFVDIAFKVTGLM